MGEIFLVAVVVFELLLFFLVNIFRAFFLRRARRWAALATLIALPSYGYILGIFIYALADINYGLSDTTSIILAFAANPFLYSFIYCFIALVFIEKIFRKKAGARVLLTEPIDAAENAAMALEIPVTGLDMIVPDLEKPEYVIVEANERPGLANHEPQPTAERFMDLLFPQTAAAT